MRGKDVILGVHVRTRFAPTPSGHLHQGNILNLAITWYAAMGYLPESFIHTHPDTAGQAIRIGEQIRSRIPNPETGEMGLRIDDLDQARVRNAYLDDIKHTLYSLGFHPSNIQPDVPDSWNQACQTSRISRYQTILDSLHGHPLVFACSCSRAETGPGPYAGKCRNMGIPLDTPGVAWRLYVPPDTTIRFHDLLAGAREIAIGKDTGSFVIRRKDGIPAYQLASLVDDHDMGINLIVRGADLLESTALQLYLSDILGYPEFRSTSFAHHALVTDSDGRKLSKSNIPLR